MAMQQPLPQGEITFDVIHNDGWIRVCITEGVATFFVDNINDQGVLIRALGRAIAGGATRGTMFTGDVVNDRIAARHIYRSESGATWLDGKVTRLADGEDGPQFQIDWDQLPVISE